MGLSNPGLIKNFKAGAAIAKCRILKFDGNLDLIQGAAVADKLIGVSTGIASASGDRVDVVLSGITEVEYGGNVTGGDLLTTDANGKAVTAAPAAGTNNRVIGVAMESGVSGDIGSVLIEQGSVQG